MLIGVLCSPYIADLPLQSSKKTDAPTPDDKQKKETAPVAPAGDEKKDTPVKKRK